MLKKKVVALGLSVLMTASMFMGCGSEGNSGVETSSDDTVKITLAIPGALGDKGFNDASQAGMDKIKETFGDKVEVETVELGFDKAKFEPGLQDVSESDADIILTGTWDMKEIVERNASLYKDKKYIVFDTDVAYDEYDLENVYSMTYKQNEAGFLAGALAALVTTSDMENVNADKKIGFVGARDTSAVINDFLVGYIQGAQFIDKDIKVEVSYVGSFTDSSKAKEMTLAQYSKGVDVVFTAAGPASIGSIEAAAETKNYVIGVDSDQALAFEGKEEANFIISSALKKVDNSLVLAIENLLNDTLEFNTHSELGIAEDAIGLANNDIYTSVVPQEIRDKVEEAKKSLLEGKITLESAIGLEDSRLQEIINSAK